MSTSGILALWAPGRPAPQGSKDANGREVSAYLPGWRAAVKRAVYAEYKALGVKPEELPYFVGPVQITRCTFVLDTGDRIDSPPDIDKLLRAVLDVLGAPPTRLLGETDRHYAKRNEGRGARVWEDDGRVVYVGDLGKTQAEPGQPTGVEMVIRGRRA